MHEIEENHKVPKRETKMESEEVTCSMTESAGYVRGGGGQNRAPSI